MARVNDDDLLAWNLVQLSFEARNRDIRLERADQRGMVACRIAVRADAVRAVAGVVEERHVVVAGISERRGNAGENLLGADVLLHRHTVRRRGHAAEHGAHPVHIAAGQFVRFAGIGVANQQCAVCADGFLMRVRQLIRPVAHAHVAVGENAHRAHAVIVRSAQHSAVVVTVGVADAPVCLGRRDGKPRAMVRCFGV